MSDSSTQTEWTLDASQLTPVDMFGRTRSQSEILRLRSSLRASRSSDLLKRTFSDSGAEGLANGCCSHQGFQNAAFETYEELDLTNSNTKNPLSKCGVCQDLDDSTDNHSRTSSHGENNSDTNESSCSTRRYKGVILALLSTVILSFATLTVALLGDSIKSNEVVFAQMFMELLFCLPLFTLERASLWLPRKAFILVLYRSIMGSIGTSLAFFAFQVMPIGNAKAIIYSSPVFTGLFSCLFLHEACGAVDILLSSVTLSGVLLVIQPPFIFGGEQTSSSILGPIFCLIVAVLVGTVFITLRKIGMYRVHPTVILIYFSISGMVLSAIVSTALREWVIPRCGRDRILLILTGTFQFVSQIALTLALRYEKATTVSLIRTTDVLFTFVLDYIFFAIIPNAITITGALLIVGSLVGITLRKWWSEKKAMERASEEEIPEEDQDEMYRVENPSITDSIRSL